MANPKNRRLRRVSGGVSNNNNLVNGEVVRIFCTSTSAEPNRSLEDERDGIKLSFQFQREQVAGEQAWSTLGMPSSWHSDAKFRAAALGDVRDVFKNTLRCAISVPDGQRAFRASTGGLPPCDQYGTKK